WLAPDKVALPRDKLRNEALTFLGDSLLMDITEFYRPVHAEMAALMDAARHGVAVKGTKLYSTTFPCHECARHITAAGIKTVIYISPYPKSRAVQLHADAISVEFEQDQKKMVNFKHFVGISPSRYID